MQGCEIENLRRIVSPITPSRESGEIYFRRHQGCFGPLAIANIPAGIDDADDIALGIENRCHLFEFMAMRTTRLVQPSIGIFDYPNWLG